MAHTDDHLKIAAYNLHKITLHKKKQIKNTKNHLMQNSLILSVTGKHILRTYFQQQFLIKTNYLQYAIKTGLIIW